MERADTDRLWPIIETLNWITGDRYRDTPFLGLTLT
jgi:hypothetical protein